MGKTIHDEINQKAFKNPFEELIVASMYTGLFIKDSINELLKPYGLGMVHYNILRIVKGQEGDFVPLKKIKDVLIDRSVNLSRSVDLLVQKEDLEREARRSDRREIKVRITQKGRLLLEELEAPMEEGMRRLSEKMGSKEATNISRSLDQIREAYRPRIN
jgi:DNA-binding MarR family transcriptional regulator